MDPSAAAVRQRPAMYLGDTGAYGLRQCLWEVVANSVDEFLAGRATRIDIALGENGAFTVTDDGGGIRPTVDLVAALSRLHSTPTVEPGRPHRHMNALAGLGLAPVVAVAECLRITSVATDLTCSRGEVSIHKPGERLARGTRVSFTPDPQIFRPITVDRQAIIDTLRGTAAILRKLEITVSPSTESLPGEDGLASLLPQRQQLGPLFQFRDLRDETLIDVVAGWSQAAQPFIRSFANLQPTDQHGVHVDGFLDALTRSLGHTTPEVVRHARDWLSLVIAVDRDSITYAGPTRGRLGTPEIRECVREALVPALVNFFTGPGAVVLGAFEAGGRAPFRGAIPLR